MTISFKTFITENKSKTNIMKVGRAKIIKIRIRTVDGKPVVQRRKKLSNVKGFTIRGGKMVRMSPSERLHRKMGAKRGKIKRRAKLARSLIKRKRALLRRKSMGL